MVTALPSATPGRPSDGLHRVAERLRSAVPVFGKPKRATLEAKLHYMLRDAPPTLFAAGRDGSVFALQLGGCGEILSRRYELEEGPKAVVLSCREHTMVVVWSVDELGRWVIVARDRRDL